jgi:hypothetical protein
MSRPGLGPAGAVEFYETDPARNFRRGFSIQTIGPLPIHWAAHVLADGHWGHAPREYRRDYRHWSVLGALCELLPRADARSRDDREHDRGRVF